MDKEAAREALELNRCDQISLGWVSNEVEALVGEVRTSLEDYAEDRINTAPLVVSRSVLHKLRNTLVLIKLYGASMLAEELEGRKFKFSSGEVVYGYLRPYLNKVWVADCKGVCSVDQYVIRPDLAMVAVNYLAYFMRSPIFLGQAIEMTHNLLLPRLRKALLESISIPLAPISGQRRIVAYLDDLQAQADELTALQDATQAELDALLPSVLDRAFRGEL